jgi:hypothetical protein
MNTIELARKAGIEDWWESGNEMRDVLDEHLERFAALVLEEHLKGVDVEPVGFLTTHTNGFQSFSKTVEGIYTDTAKSITQIYTAEQMAAVRHRALEEAAKVCDPYTHGQWFAAAIRALGGKK